MEGCSSDIYLSEDREFKSIKQVHVSCSLGKEHGGNHQGSVWSDQYNSVVRQTGVVINIEWEKV